MEWKETFFTALRNGKFICLEVSCHRRVLDSIVLWTGESDDEVLKSRENVSGTPCDEQYCEGTPFSISI